MYILNGNQNRVLRMLKSYGLSEYESKVYFTLLIAGKSKVWELYKRSSVPQPKIYFVVEGLKQKGLVEIDGNPKIISSRGFSRFLKDSIKSKEREIKSMKKFGEEVEELIHALKPIADKYKTYKVFEPKYRRR